MWPPLRPTVLPWWFFSAQDFYPSCAKSFCPAAMRPDTPAAIVYKATWPDEKVIRGRVDQLPQMAEENGITKTALILVGGFLEEDFQRSKLYDPAFGHEFREAAR